MLRHLFDPDPDMPRVCRACDFPEANGRAHSRTPPVGGGVPRTGLEHPEASFAAAADTAPRLGTLRRSVVAAVHYSAEGLTDDQLEVILDRSHQSVSSARNGLVRDGWLEAALDDKNRPVQRRTRANNHAQVWIVPAAAARRLT